MRQNLENFKHVATQKDYILSYLFTSILGFGMFMIIPFIAPYMVSNVGFVESDLTYLYIIGGIMTIITARFVGKKCDSVGSYKMFFWTASLSAIPIFLLTNLGEVPFALAIAVSSFFMLSGTARFIPAMTLISAVVKPSERGTFMSLENAVRQLSTGAASQAAGLILGMSATGKLTNFSIIGFIAVIMTLLTLAFAKNLKTKYNLR